MVFTTKEVNIEKYAPKFLSDKISLSFSDYPITFSMYSR